MEVEGSALSKHSREENSQCFNEDRTLSPAIRHDSADVETLNAAEVFLNIYYIKEDTQIPP